MTSLSSTSRFEFPPARLSAVGIRRGAWLDRALLALSLGGWAFGLIVFGTLVVQGGLPVGGDLAAYLRAGDDVAAGRPVYVGTNGEAGAFNYAPPWAIAFAALAWVPDIAMQALIMTLSVLAIRYVAGSWVRAGLVFWYPVSVMVIMAGNIDLLIAAAIVLAAKGHAGPLAFTALAKVAPIIAMPIRQWRQAAIAIAIAVAVTLPFLHLWPEWIAYLLRQPTTIAISVGPPWFVRLPVALVLLSVRKPWASALAVVVAMPSMWLGTFTILIAAVRLWADARVAPAPVTMSRDRSTVLSIRQLLRPAPGHVRSAPPTLSIARSDSIADPDGLPTAL